MRAAKKNRALAQSMLEYAVLIVCVVAALVGMQIYLKRGFSGRLRQASDEIGQQYEPKKTNSALFTTQRRDAESWIDPEELKDSSGRLIGYSIIRTELSDETTKTWGYEEVGKME